MSSAIAVMASDMVQDFELGNGTAEPYSQEIWNCTTEMDNQQVHSGAQSQKIQTMDKGGTVGIRVMGASGSMDLAKAKKLTMWVYDTQGDNTIEMRLKDINGNGGSGQDGKTLWSSTKARRGAWTRIEWDLTSYPSVEGLDRTKIASIELFEYHAGTYYFDDVGFE